MATRGHDWSTAVLVRSHIIRMIRVVLVVRRLRTIPGRMRQAANLAGAGPRQYGGNADIRQIFKEWFLGLNAPSCEEFRR